MSQEFLNPNTPDNNKNLEQRPGDYFEHALPGNLDESGKKKLREELEKIGAPVRKEENE